MKPTCKQCHQRTAIYTWKGTSTKMCFSCFKEWRLNVKCPVCKGSAIGNVVETEDDESNIYFWHFECWQQEMEEATRALTRPSTMRNKTPEIAVSTL